MHCCHTNKRFVICQLTVSCAGTAEPIEIPDEMCTHRGPWNHVLDIGGGADPPWKGELLTCSCTQGVNIFSLIR